MSIAREDSVDFHFFKARLDTSKGKSSQVQVALHRRTRSPDLLHNLGKPGNCQSQVKLVLYFSRTQVV